MLVQSKVIDLELKFTDYINLLTYEDNYSMFGLVQELIKSEM